MQFVAEANGGGHLLEPITRSFKSSPSSLDAHLKNVLGRSCSYLASEHPLEVAHAHRHAIGKVLDRQLRLQMLGDPDLQLTDRRHFGGLRRERHADLRLSGRPAQKQHQLTGGLMGERAAAVLFYPGQSEVDACRDSSARIDVAILDPEWFMLDFDVRILRRELLA